MILPELSRGGGGGARQLGWASCLVSAGRVSLAGGTTFSQVNTLTRLPGTTQRRAKCHVFSKFQVLKHKFTLQKQISSAKPTLI